MKGNRVAFNFNEVRSVGQSQPQVSPTPVDAKLETITVQASGSKKLWAGHSAAEAQQLYRELYDLGDIVSAHYFVEMNPYNDNDTKDLRFFDDQLTGYLATETNLSVIEADYEQVKVGAFYFNTLSGVQDPDIQLTLLETKDARILTSFMQWREMMVNNDGTLNPPASYAMEITVGLFSRELGLEDKPFDRTFLVAPTLASLDNLASNNFESLRVPVTLKVLRPFSLE
jgi:hypothetical protein